MEISNALFKLKKACISIQRSQPFFAYLSLFLKFKEVKSEKKWEEGGLGAGVDIKGNFFYNPSFIEGLNEDETRWLIMHELGHLVFLSALRLGNRNHQIFNISSDIAINSLLQQNGFSGINGAIIPSYNHEVVLFKKSKYEQIIKKCNEKTAEQMYDEIKIPKEFEKEFYVGGNGEDSEGLGEKDSAYEKTGYKQIDKHFYESRDLTEEEKKKLEREWIQRIQEAFISAQMRGITPAGIERVIGNLHEGEINWKALLYRYITSFIPQDYSYHRPSKRSIASGFYLPDTTKEKIDVCVAVDTSGSIGDEELIDFISEIVRVAKAFKNRIDMTFISADSEVNGVWKIENGNIEQIKKVSIKGGGGTAHLPVFNHIQNKIRECSVVVCFTDGFSDLNKIDFNKFKFEKIFVISKNGDDGQLKDKKCRVIKL